MRTRIAPTPSGYLHRGNAANALLTHWWATSEGGTVALRIDDVDAPRMRPEYVHDVHDLLKWLQIPLHRSPDPRRAGVGTQEGRVERARAVLDQARRNGLPAYACRCSRSILDGVPRGGCPAGCRTAGHALEPGGAVLRIAVPEGAFVRVDGRDIDLAAAMGDFVIWRRDDLPAYQWFSVVEDTDAQVTHILRGEDLVESSAAQLHLAQYLDDTCFRDAVIRHHGLVVDERAMKLSKSQLGAAGPLPRTDEEREEVQRIARSLGRAIGLPVA